MFELPCEIVERIETMVIAEKLLVFAVTAFDFAVVPRCARSDEFVTDAKILRRGFEKRL